MNWILKFKRNINDALDTIENYYRNQKYRTYDCIKVSNKKFDKRDIKVLRLLDNRSPLKLPDSLKNKKVPDFARIKKEETIKKEFQKLLVKKFGPARITKILHKKFPNHIPILDKWVGGFYGVPQQWNKNKELKTKAMARATIQARQDVKNNQKFLERINKKLKEEEIICPQIKLSNLRILDILLGSHLGSI